MLQLDRDWMVGIFGLEHESLQSLLVLFEVYISDLQLLLVGREYLHVTGVLGVLRLHLDPSILPVDVIHILLLQATIHCERIVHHAVLATLATVLNSHI